MSDSLGRGMENLIWNCQGPVMHEIRTGEPFRNKRRKMQEKILNHSFEEWIILKW